LKWGDVVSNAIQRLGMTGLILVVSLVIFAFLAGGVVIHRLETAPTASSEQQTENDQGESKTKKSNPGQGHSKSSNDSNEDADTEND